MVSPLNRFGVQQSGVVTPSHIVVWVTDGVVEDGGTVPDVFNPPPAITPLDGTETIFLFQQGVFVQCLLSAATILSANEQSGTTYSLQNSDLSRPVVFTNASPVTVTVPAGLGVGFNCILIQRGAGQVDVVAGGGVLVNSVGSLTHLAGQYAAASLIADIADNYILSGSLG